jgi:hypothetical protein
VLSGRWRISSGGASATGGAFGEHRYGDRSALIDDWDGPSYSTCANLGWVAKAFESSRRREHLSIKHHAEVASLSPRAADELLAWCEETREATGKPRPTSELRDEVRRRRIEQMSPRRFGVSETMAVTLAPAPPPDTSTLVLIPVAAAPRHEPEVQEQLGEATLSAGPIVEFRNFLRYAEARLPPDAVTAVLLEAVDQTKQLLGRLTKRLRRSGGDDGDDKVVVNLRG